MMISKFNGLVLTYLMNLPVDFATAVKMDLDWKSCKTLKSFCEELFIPKLKSLLRNVLQAEKASSYFGNMRSSTVDPAALHFLFREAPLADGNDRTPRSA